MRLKASAPYGNITGGKIDLCMQLYALCWCTSCGWDRRPDIQLTGRSGALAYSCRELSPQADWLQAEASWVWWRRDTHLRWSGCRAEEELERQTHRLEVHSPGTQGPTPSSSAHLLAAHSAMVSPQSDLLPKPTLERRSLLGVIFNTNQNKQKCGGILGTT